MYKMRTFEGHRFYGDVSQAAFYQKVTGQYPQQITQLEGVKLEQHQDVIRVLGQMDKIMAIKMVRAITGWGLKESKDWVEEVVL